jgi:hypothetical protein
MSRCGAILFALVLAGVAILGPGRANAQTFDLTIGVTGSGTTNPSAGVHSFDAGSTVQLSAFAAIGAIFDHWEGDASGTNAFTSIVMDSDKSVTAVFDTPVNYTLTTNVIGNGTLGPAGTYLEGSNVPLTAVADPGFAFDHWEGDLTGTNQFGQFILLDANKSVTAVFVAADHTLTVTQTGEGNASPAPGVYGIVAGRTVTFSANTGFPVPPGWAFTQWNGDLTGTDNPANLLIDGNKSVEAVFEFVGVPEFTLTTIADGFGIVSPAGENTYTGNQSDRTAGHASRGLSV